MSQVTIYLDKNTEAKMRAAVKNAGISKSKWVAGLIREKTAEVWPEDVARLAGTWPDLPTAEEIRKGGGVDTPREPF